MLEVIFRPKAEEDLLTIARHTKALWSDRQAARYLADIRRKIEFVAEFPGIGSDTFGLPPIYRKVPSGSHRIIYRCSEAELVIVRIIHEREDVPEE